MPQREQKKLATPLLARLYTSVGPVIGLGGKSRKMGSLAGIVRLDSQVASKIAQPATTGGRTKNALVLYNQRKNACSGRYNEGGANLDPV